MHNSCNMYGRFTSFSFIFFFEDIKEVLENENTLFVFLFTKKNQIRYAIGNNNRKNNSVF